MKYTPINTKLECCVFKEPKNSKASLSLMSAKRKQSEKKKGEAPPLDKKRKLSPEEHLKNDVWAVSDVVFKISQFMDLLSLTEASRADKKLHKQFTVQLHKRAKAIAKLVNPLTAKKFQLKQFAPNNRMWYSRQHVALVIYIKGQHRAKIFMLDDPSYNSGCIKSFSSNGAHDKEDLIHYVDPLGWSVPRFVLPQNMEQFLAKALLRAYPIYIAYFSDHLQHEKEYPPSPSTMSKACTSKTICGYECIEVGGDTRSSIHVTWSNSDLNLEGSKVNVNLYYNSLICFNPKCGNLELKEKSLANRDLRDLLVEKEPQSYPAYRRQERDLGIAIEADEPISIYYEFTGCYLSAHSIQQSAPDR